MLNLRYQFNSAMTTLPEFGAPKFDVVPVLKKDGDFERVKWLGFIDVEDAKVLRQAKPVKLDIRHYSVAPGTWPKWRDVGSDKAVQGCLIASGVYAVVQDGAPRLVKR